MTAAKKLLLVEDDPTLGVTLKERLANEGYQVQWASTAAAARSAFEGSRDWDLVLFDVGLPDGSGSALIEEIVARFPKALVIVTTVYDDEESLLEALAAGAQGYLLKDQDGPAIAHRLAMIEHGEVPISPAIARRLLQRLRPEAPSGVALSPRETEVLRMIGRGLKSSEVAEILAISPQTVATHVKTIYRKLEITSRAEAALEARRRGLA